MKCLIVLSLMTVGCALAQNINDGRYYPEVLNAKFNDGKWRPDSDGKYTGSADRFGSGGAGVNFGSGSGFSAGAGADNGFGAGFGAGFGTGSSGSGSGVGSRFQASSSSGFGGASVNAFVATVQAVPAPAFVQAAPAPAFVQASSEFSSAGSKKSGSAGFGSSFGSNGEVVGVQEDTRDLNEDGSYFYKVVADNGIDFSETGRVENTGSEVETMRVKGYYEFVADDGVKYRVDYIADENGFQATGDHLPTPPPIPAEILESLKSQGLL